MSETDEECRYREKKILDEVVDVLEYYAMKLSFTWKFQRAVSVFVMFISTISPLLVVGSALNNAFGLSEAAIKIGAVLVTVILSLLEGLKRIFRLEQRWISLYTVRASIKRARHQYRLSQIGVPVGSDLWVANLKTFVDAYEEAIDTQVKDLFDGFDTNAKKDDEK